MSGTFFLNSSVASRSCDATSETAGDSSASCFIMRYDVFHQSVTSRSISSEFKSINGPVIQTSRLVRKSEKMDHKRKYGSNVNWIWFNK
jgi:hypothetical protein